MMTIGIYLLIALGLFVLTMVIVMIVAWNLDDEILLDEQERRDGLRDNE